MSPAAATRPRLEELRPEPASFWIGRAPRSWSGPQSLFLDLAHGTLAAPRFRAGRPERSLLATPGETLYLPMWAGDSLAVRTELVAEVVAAGSSVLVQLAPGERIDREPPAEACVRVYDPTAALVTGELAVLDDIPSGAGVVFPLVAGVTGDEAEWSPALDRLAEVGVAWVQPLVPALSATDRRQLAEHGQSDTFDALFHGTEPEPAPFARSVARRGMRLHAPRPVGGSVEPGARRRNRELATHLAIVAELWLLAGRPAGRADGLFHASRRIAAETHDIATIAREGNLSVVDWLDPELCAEIERRAGGQATLYDELMTELGGGPSRG